MDGSPSVRSFVLGERKRPDQREEGRGMEENEFENIELQCFMASMGKGMKGRKNNVMECFLGFR